MSEAVRGAVLAPLQQWWRGLARREQTLVGVAAAAIGLLLLWLVAVQPAWRTLARAPTELEALEVQLQTMQRLAAEAQELRAAPPVTPDQAAAALKSATARLGDQARLLLQGDRAVLTLSGVGSGALRDWLAEARAGARARPLEANLTRATQGYSGTLVVGLGGAP